METPTDNPTLMIPPRAIQAYIEYKIKFRRTIDKIFTHRKEKQKDLGKADDDVEDFNHNYACIFKQFNSYLCR